MSKHGELILDNTPLGFTSVLIILVSVYLPVIIDNINAITLVIFRLRRRIGGRIAIAKIQKICFLVRSIYNISILLEILFLSVA